MSNQLLQQALNIKKRFLKMYAAANAGHIGSSLSCTEILTFIYFGWKQDNDEVILSKGHAAAALYSVLAEKGILSEEEINTFYKNGTYLPAHPPAGKIKGIPFATGSLGHGLSLATGLGLSKKLKESNDKVFCVTSDGELNEGSIWEAAMFAAHHNLTNVIWFIDKNNLQGFGKSEDIINMGDLAKKIEAFGWNVFTVDGHNFNEMKTIKQQYSSNTKPTAIICNTNKGRGWKKYEGKVDCHYLPMKDTDFDDIIQNLETEFSLQIQNNA